MTELKTEKIMELRVDYETFLLLMFGFYGKMDFKHSYKGKSWIDYKDRPFTKFARQKFDDDLKHRRKIEVIQLWSAYKGQQGQETLLTAMKHWFFENISSKGNNDSLLFTFGEDKHMWLEHINDKHYKETTTYSFNFSHILGFLKSEYELDSSNYVDWFYPLIGKEVPCRSKNLDTTTSFVGNNIPKESLLESNVPDNSVKADGYVKIDKLPKLIQLAISGYKHFDWDNLNVNSPSDKYNSNALTYLNEEAERLSLTHMLNKNGKLSKKITDQLVRIINPDNDSPE